MHPARQFNQPQSYGVYFPQSGAQLNQHHAVPAPNYQGYGGGPPQFYQGQPVIPIKPIYPPTIPYSPNTSQNFGGQQFIRPPFSEPSLHHPPPIPLIGQRPPTPPQVPTLFTPPGNQRPQWSANVTPPSPFYNNESFNAIELELESVFEGSSPVLPCNVPLPPRLKALGQYVAQNQNAVMEINNNFNEEPAAFRKPPTPGSDNKDVFKLIASQHGIFLESPPKTEEIELVNIEPINTDAKESSAYENKDKPPFTDGMNVVRTGKRHRDDDIQSRAPLSLPAKIVAERNLSKQKVKDDWWSMSDTSNLSGTNSVSKDDYDILSKPFNDSKELPELSTYSSFPDSSVDISKVLAESSMNTSIDSKVSEVFDDSVDYIEEHEFLSYDVTSSPFELNDSDVADDDSDIESVKCTGYEMPENPLPDNQASSYIERHVNKGRDEGHILNSGYKKMLQIYQNDLNQSELKTKELLDFGVVNDKNIELLASAIVTGVIAKAAISCISSNDGERGDVIETAKNNTLSIESIVSTNQNTNAEIKQVKTVGSEASEDGSVGRQRLYSWPYETDNHSKEKRLSEDHCQTNTNKSQFTAKDVVETTVETLKDTADKKQTSDPIAKKVIESSVDFEKYYFKQKASQHGIEIVSPGRLLKTGPNSSSDSDNETEKEVHKTIPKQNAPRSARKGLNEPYHQFSRSQSESSDHQSFDESDLQTDPSYIFKQNASRCGIKIQNPKETVELSVENSDAEPEICAFQNKILNIDDPSRLDTSTPEPDKLVLNPESPEFKPGWKKTMESSQRISVKNEMRADAPEFNPGALNTSSSDIKDRINKIEMRIDAPEFNPGSFTSRKTASSFDSVKKMEEPRTAAGKIFHIPTPKQKQEKPTIGIQASPETSNSSMNTKRMKTKECSMQTASCYSREVCVNTDFPGNLEKESHHLTVKPSKSFASKNTNTDKPRRRSIAVNVNIQGGTQENEYFVRPKPDNNITLKEDEQAEIVEQLKSLQIEVMRHRANLHMTRIFLMQNRIQKETNSLIDSLKFSQDKQAADAILEVVGAKLSFLDSTVVRINSLADETVAKVKAGHIFKTLPDFVFFSDNIVENRIIANQQLFNVASGSTAQEKQPPIKINFSPTNENLIRFKAEPQSPEKKTTRKMNKNTAKDHSPSACVSDAVNPSGLVNETKSPPKESMRDQGAGLRTPTGGKAMERPKQADSLMDLDLDSDDEVTEVSTALDGTSLNVEPHIHREETEYPENKDLKYWISSKMSEVYGANKYTNAGASSDLLHQINDFEDSGLGSMNKENVAKGKPTSEKGSRTREGSVTSCPVSEMNDRSLVKTDNSDVNNGTSEFAENGVPIIKNDEAKLKQEQQSGVGKSNSVSSDNESETKTNDLCDEYIQTNEPVSENWGGLELDQNELYESPEIHPDLEKISKEDLNTPQNPFDSEGASSAAFLSDKQNSTDNLEKEVADDNFLLSKPPYDSNLNELRVLPEIQTKDSVNVNLESQMITTNATLNSSVSLVDSVNNGLPSSMSLMQSVGNSVMAQNLMMTSLNPVLYQLVVAQLMKAYPALAANPDMLSSVAIQQASLLQHYMATGQMSDAHMTEALQGNMLDNTEQGAVGFGDQMSLPDNKDQNDSTVENVKKVRSENRMSVNENGLDKADALQKNKGPNSELGMNEDLQQSDKNSESVGESSGALPKAEAQPYRPPCLRGDITASPSSTILQSSKVDKPNMEDSVPQKPVSALQNLSFPVRSVESFTSANRPNSSTTRADLSKPLRRPFKQPTPGSKSMENFNYPSNVVNTAIQNSAPVPLLNDSNGPIRRPFNPNIVGSELSNKLPVTFSNVSNPVQVGASQPVTMQNFQKVNSTQIVTAQSFEKVNSSQSFSNTKFGVSSNVTADKSKKPPDFIPSFAKRHSPELRDKEAPSQDFLPSFVKQSVYAGRKNHVSKANAGNQNQQNFHNRQPPRFRRMSAPQRQSSTEEDWDDEIDEFPETKTMKFNPQRELHIRSVSARKPVPTDSFCNSSTSQMKNKEADATNPLIPRSVSFPGEVSQGSSGLSDIPLPKKLRTGEDNMDQGRDKEEEKEEEEWCEVTTKKKKQKELKKFSAPYLNSAPIQSQKEKQQKQSNFERLIEKIQEKYPSASRSETIDSVTKLREQRGGNLKGMNLHDIVSQACNIIEKQTKATKGNNPQIPGLWSSQRISPPKLNLPNFSLTAVHREDEEICVICHDPLSSEETKILDCKHVFHADCINQWVYGRERTCPTCRQHALFPEEFPRLGK